MAMIHSFEVCYNKNGNITMSFYEDNKKRNIIFTKGTEACKQAEQTLQHYHIMSYMDKYKGDNQYKAVINHLRKSFLFRANENNRSIFRPVQKLTLKTISI